LKGYTCKYLYEKVEKSPSSGSVENKPTVSVIMYGLQLSQDGNRVLMDSGANEVVRPYNPAWWNEVMVLRNKGKPVKVKLAGGQEIEAAMTQHGEIMLPDKNYQDKVGWILPVSRLTNELGVQVTWAPGGGIITQADGRKVKARTEQGLTFLDWEDVQPIRSALIESQRKGGEAGEALHGDE